MPRTASGGGSDNAFALLGLAVVVVVFALVASGMIWYFRQTTTTPMIPPRQRCVATVGGVTAELDLEQARNAALITGVSVRRGLPARAASIALATAFQESDLRNIDYGDRDSIGLFQQRPSQGWGTVVQIMDPYYSTGKFYDALVKVPNWQTGDINDIAQTVQKSGFPEAYRKHVERARILASALTGQAPAAFSCLVRQLPEPTPDVLAAAIMTTYGTARGTVTAATEQAPALLALSSTGELAWSQAAFSQAYASTTGVQAVQVGRQSWTVAGDAVASWQGATPAVGPQVVQVGFRR